MEHILEVLKAHQGEYVSGESLAKLAGITRAAIWKQINQLRESGYLIESAPHCGYKLLSLTESLHPYEIKSGLQTERIGQAIDYHEVIDSTNHRARKLASEGAPEGTLVIAECQTGGRGRLGRNWSAPTGMGLWFSLILRPQISASELAVITLLTAVTMARAIKESTGVQVEIKWPNDLLYQGRKLVGILAEMNGEMDRVNYLILGIGVNVRQSLEDFPEELRHKATSLQMIRQEDIGRLVILQNFLREFERSYTLLGMGQTTNLIDYARKHSATLGREVTINQGFGRNRTGAAMDLDQDGSLWLKDAAGNLEKIYSGEIIELTTDVVF